MPSFMWGSGYSGEFMLLKLMIHMRNVSQSEHRHIRGYLYESRLLYRISHMQDSGLNARVWELSSQPYSLICYIHHIPGMIFYVSGFLFFKLIIIYRVRGVLDERPRTITILPSYLEIFNSLMVFPLRAPELSHWHHLCVSQSQPIPGVL